MKYTLKTTTKFKKDYERCKKRGYDMDYSYLYDSSLGLYLLAHKVLMMCLLE